jgi:peptide/nickel transport system substrate-binding protein
MKTIRTTLAVSLLALATGLSGTPALAATPDNALVIAQNIDDIVTIDPATAYEFSSGEYVTNTYDQLVQYDATDTETLAPGLATEWEIDAENRTITFTLREGVTFHSGNPLRAEDVVGSWKRVMVLDRAPAFILGNLGWTAENIEEMATADGNTVTIRWEGDFAPSFVLNVLASRPASVVDMETVMAHEVDDDMGHAWLNENSAGTGPFTLRTFRPGEVLMLDSNPDYFGGAPAMEQILIRHVAEASTQRLLLESGDVDMAKNLTPDQVAGLEGNEDIKVETYPQAAVHWFSFNQKTDSLTNPALWEAARYLVDYEGMAESFLKGQMQVHQAFWPAGFPGALTDTPFTYDPERAREILEEGGVELPITVTLDVINANPFNDMAQSLQQTFAEAGINFEILPGTGAQVITKYRARTHEAMLLYWGPDFMDPHSNAKAFAYNADNSDDAYVSTTTWRNAWMPPEEINEMTMAALAEQDADRRDEMYLELQRAMQEEAPFVIMFQAVKQVAMADRVEGFVNGSNSDFVYYRLVEKN